MVNKIIHCDATHCVFQPLSTIEQLETLRQQGPNLFWLDLYDPSEDELVRIGETFDLHPLALEDASQEHQRPKVELYDNFFFVVFYTVQQNILSGELAVQELDIFVGRNYLITVHRAAMSELQEVEQRWTRNGKLREEGIGGLLYVLLDTIADHYFPVGDALAARAELLEDMIFAGQAQESSTTFKLLELKKSFLEFRRVVMPERDVLNILSSRDSQLFENGVNLYFRDIHDHISRLTDTLDLYREQLSSTMDANLSLASHELNKVMRTMTSASIILMFDALIAGIYGMNFDVMPELHWHLGYLGALIIMVLASMILGLLFKKLRWL
jgi:magnesium transporter